MFEKLLAIFEVGEKKLTTEKSRMMNEMLSGKRLSIYDQGKLKTSHLHSRMSDLIDDGFPIHREKKRVEKNGKSQLVSFYYINPCDRNYCIFIWNSYVAKKKYKASL